jgi:DedD protein
LKIYRMGLFSFFRKNKQESAPGDNEFYSRAQEQSDTVRGRGKRRQSTKTNEAVDPVLPEKKRARRRLIGAIALVLASIIGLPMILDSEPKPLSDDIKIEIPSKNKPPQSQNNRRMSPATVAARLPVTAGLDKNEELIDAPNLSAQRALSAAPVTSRSGRPESSSGLKPSVQADAKVLVQANTAEKIAATTQANSILESKAAAKIDRTKATADKTSGRFVVQVAALASQDKADELRGKLKDAGIKSFSQKIPTRAGERIRIRIGPFGSKDEADKMRVKIGKLGLSGTLVPA